MKRFFGRLTGASLVLVGGIFSTSCDRVLPPITITLPLGQNTTFPPPGTPEELAGTPFNDFTLPLGAERCAFPNAEALEAQLRQVAGTIGNAVQIEGVVIDSVTFKSTRASEGTLSFLNEVALRFQVENETGTEEFLLGSYSMDGLDDPIKLESENEFDLWALLDEDAECISSSVTLSGVWPEEPVTFSTEMTVTLRLSVSQ
jgi:hypothetical protein